MNRYAPFARALRRSGMRALLIEPMLMSRIITPRPAPNSDARISPRMTGIGMSGVASGIGRSDRGNTTQPSAYAGPSPIRRPIRDATTAPINPPTAPIPSASPRAPGETPSVPVAYRMNSAPNANVNRLTVATASIDGRMIGSWRTNAMPATSRQRIDPASASIGGSGARIRRRNTTEPRNDRASVSIASGAPRTWTRSPPIVGPATYANDRLPLRRDIASMYRSRLVTETKTVFHDRSNTTDNDPARKPTT